MPYTPSVQPTDLVTLDYLKSWMQITRPDSDAPLQQLINGVSVCVMSMTNRKSFKLASFTETINGNGKDFVVLRNTPAASITSISIGGRAIDPSRYTMLNTYSIQMGAGAFFDYGMANVVITYMAGFEPVPFDLQEAVAEIIAFKWAKVKRPDSMSATLDGQTVAFSQRDIPPGVLPVIQNYKQLPFFGR